VRPSDLTLAVAPARHRLQRRIYVGPPDAESRRSQIARLLDGLANLSEADLNRVVALTDGYSSADIRELCREAAYGPVRDVGGKELQKPSTKVPSPSANTASHCPLRWERFCSVTWRRRSSA
jgi:SpoVK/Ycf46/Vps4 family AAA+-type ATPase